MDIKIKEANKSNFEDLIFLRILLLKHDSQLDSSELYNIARIQKSVSYMKKYLKKEDNKYFLAYHNDLPVSYLHVTYDDGKNKNSSYASELYVLDAYRGNGIGKMMMMHLFKFLKKKNITENTLTTAKYRNKKVIDFYKRLGYSITKEDKKKNIVYFIKTIIPPKTHS